MDEFIQRMISYLKYTGLHKYSKAYRDYKNLEDETQEYVSHESHARDKG